MSKRVVLALCLGCYSALTTRAASEQLDPDERRHFPVPRPRHLLIIDTNRLTPPQTTFTERVARCTSTNISWTRITYPDIFRTKQCVNGSATSAALLPRAAVPSRRTQAFVQLSRGLVQPAQFPPEGVACTPASEPIYRPQLLVAPDVV
jgi:hypothetical protein